MTKIKKLPKLPMSPELLALPPEQRAKVLKLIAEQLALDELKRRAGMSLDVPNEPCQEMSSKRPL